MKEFEKIIIALDVLDLERAKYFLEILSPYVQIFKIGPRLFIPYGRKVIELVKSYNCDIFLDLKLHDIPSQVSQTVKRISELGVKMFTLHALGGKEMIIQAVNTINKVSYENRPYVLAVTILTSLDKKDLQILDFKNKINILVFKLAKLALTAGADGIICSPEEVGYLKKKISQKFIAVVPGIRIDFLSGDQKRIATAREAFDRGADYIVVGRAVLNASNPLDALKEVRE